MTYNLRSFIVVKRRHCGLLAKATNSSVHVRLTSCFSMLDLDPKNVLSSPGQCHFNEVVSVVMVHAENHLATSYPCHDRGLLSPAVKHRRGILHLMRLTLCQLCLYMSNHPFKSFSITCFLLELHCFYLHDDTFCHVYFS